MRFLGFYLPFLAIPLLGLPLTYFAAWLLYPPGYKAELSFGLQAIVLFSFFRMLPFIVYARICSAAYFKHRGGAIGRIEIGRAHV